ncbi:lipoprotein 17-related variable surface protein [Mycoplasmopsis columbinasalis]|uniref:Lipoprotein associated domain n=1 Tax=Mycoplasmopsis columbinasalis TaxID=114880 RepID=A0A449BAQ2_9BACT|nr:lipoprotein 17-related variable surface protein [Mycoplasmopsis columbinasalis]VEU78247.1 Lipoprotein associated domain [Mycoplasmopsis columbinasalis]
MKLGKKKLIFGSFVSFATLATSLTAISCSSEDGLLQEAQQKLKKIVNNNGAVLLYDAANPDASMPKPSEIVNNFDEHKSKLGFFIKNGAENVDLKSYFSGEEKNIEVKFTPLSNKALSYDDTLGRLTLLATVTQKVNDKEIKESREISGEGFQKVTNIDEDKIFLGAEVIFTDSALAQTLTAQTVASNFDSYKDKFVLNVPSANQQMKRINDVYPEVSDVSFLLQDSQNLENSFNNSEGILNVLVKVTYKNQQLTSEIKQVSGFKKDTSDPVESADLIVKDLNSILDTYQPKTTIDWEAENPDWVNQSNRPTASSLVNGFESFSQKFKTVYVEKSDSSQTGKTLSELRTDVKEKFAFVKADNNLGILYVSLNLTKNSQNSKAIELEVSGFALDPETAKIKDALDASTTKVEYAGEASDIAHIVDSDYTEAKFKLLVANPEHDKNMDAPEFVELNTVSNNIYDLSYEKVEDQKDVPPNAVKIKVTVTLKANQKTKISKFFEVSTGFKTAETTE